jgi:hypothetical protein
MVLANNDRPIEGSDSKSTNSVDSRVNADSATPPQGNPARERDIQSRKPPRPQSADSRPHQQAAPIDTAPTDDRVAVIDFTPAPVVITAPARESTKLEECTDAKQLHAALRRERSARNTPAEPVASRRFRERAHQIQKSAAEPKQARIASNICDDRVDTATDLRPSAQYFPPMRPPESGHGHVATHPKVQVVPDCDTRQRTARSLRRQSSLPPAMGSVTGSLTQSWPLYVLVAAVACVMAIALVRGLTVLAPKHHVAPPLESSTPVVSPKLAPSAVRPAESRPPDAGPAASVPGYSRQSIRAKATAEASSKATPGGAQLATSTSTITEPTVF